jgi:protocadherin Fat 4
MSDLATDIAVLQVQHYIFVVQAQDSGRPSLSSTLTVYFNVVDLNDNAPLFDPMSYSNEVFENVTVGTNVVTVSATDLDSGLWSSHRSFLIVLFDPVKRSDYFMYCPI